MTSTERVKAVMEGKPADRIAGTFWRHIPLHDRNLNDFTKKTLSMRNEYCQDVIKLCPNGYFMQEDWDCEFEWPHNTESFPKCLHRPINDPMQWNDLKRLDIRKGALRREIEAAKRVVDLCKGETPVLATVFSPLKVAAELTTDYNHPEVINAQIHYHPEQVLHGLEIITEVTKDYIKAMCEAGVDGVFFATQDASEEIMPLNEFLRFGKYYDLQAMQALGKNTWFNVLHIHCNRRIYFDHLVDYPVQAFNWEDIRGDLSLQEARSKTNRVLMGGIDQYKDFCECDRILLKKNLKDRIRCAHSVAGNSYIAAPGCVVPLEIPEARFYAFREALEEC